MSKYRAYPEYKDSGVEWLGEIPNLWPLSRHKHVANFQKGKNPTVLLDEPNDGAFIYLSMDYLRGNAAPSYAQSEKSSYIATDDQVLVIWDGSNAGEFVKAKKGIVSSTMAAADLASDLDADYYWYACMCLEPEMRRHATGMGIPHVNGDELKSSVIPRPSIHEQQAIASFLDHETAKIDTLIEKQQQLIKLLKEKRQAVISHAVTKGLNPHAKMRDSGVEWLGEVPEHWKVKRLKNTSEIVDCRNKTPEYFENGDYLVIRTTNVKSQNLNLNGALYTDESNFKIWTQRGVPPAGSILFTREAPAGEICLVPDDLKFCMGQRMMNFICHSPEYTDYLFDFLLSDCLERYIASVSHGSTVSHLRVEQVENIPVLVPPLAEAKEIHKNLEVIRAKYSALTQEAESAIYLMQERRTALISAAVTGKIDVRDWLAPADSHP